MPLEIGQLIESKYRIVSLIGEGGMGAVYEGENVRIGRRVAIKVLHAALTDNKEVVQRFEREAQAAGRIGSDHILEVIDLGELPDGDHFMVMEYLEGEPLSARIERLGRLSPAELAPLAKQLLRGLGAAHKAGIVHRDLKPDNVFVLRQKAGQADFVKIIDFGISKFQSLGGDAMKMTRTGTVMGTPYYMSPEQASGSREADNRSDLYSVGVILYEAVTGRVPFEATTFNQLMFKIVLAEIPSPEMLVANLDPAFAAMILKAMARDVNRRFQSADEFIAAIDAWQNKGATVTIPPALASDLVPAGAEASAAQLAARFAASGQVPAATAGSWETSPSPRAPAKPRRLVVVAAAAASVFALGVAVTIGYFVLSSKGRTDPMALASASAASPAASVIPAANPITSAAPLPPAVSVAAPASAAPPSAPIAVTPRERGPGSGTAKVAAPTVAKPAPPKPPGKTPVGTRPKSTPDFGY